LSATLDLDGSDSPCDAGRPPRWLFKVVDLVSGETLVERASARATVRALAVVDSIFDVSIFVSVPGPGGWRQLTPGEHRILWNFRGY
jgi:hypothetical protein